MHRCNRRPIMMNNHWSAELWEKLWFSIIRLLIYKCVQRCFSLKSQTNEYSPHTAIIAFTFNIFHRFAFEKSGPHSLQHFILINILDVYIIYWTTWQRSNEKENQSNCWLFYWINNISEMRLIRLDFDIGYIIAI